jgi:hypothetical protein
VDEILISGRNIAPQNSIQKYIKIGKAGKIIKKKEKTEFYYSNRQFTYIRLDNRGK